MKKSMSKKIMWLIVVCSAILSVVLLRSDARAEPRASNSIQHISYLRPESRNCVLGPKMVYNRDGLQVVMPAWCWAENMMERDDLTAEERQSIENIINIYGPTDNCQHYHNAGKIIN